MRDLLFLSNGHGEDMIACRILDELQAMAPRLGIDAWPMVGRGEAYAARGVRTVGAANLLPSSGFATLEWKLMGADLRAGWIRTHWNQYRFARGLRGRYRRLVAVGDIVPIVASVASRIPFDFVGCAKSYYYDAKYGYTGLEKRLLRRHCSTVFPRDSLTAGKLASSGVPVRDLGNPMMDGLEGTGDRLGVPADAVAVAMLPGTREDAEVNFLDLLDAARETASRHRDPARLRFLFPVRPAFDARAVASIIAADRRLQGLAVAAGAQGARHQMTVALHGGAEAVVVKDRFADTLRLAAIAVGMAGTANEQAVGLGIPLVAVPASGIQGERFVRMKMQYFGPSAVAVARDAASVAAEVLAILADPGRAARMGEAGRERMGGPGASRAIAGEIAAALEARGRQASAA